MLAINPTVSASGQEPDSDGGLTSARTLERVLIPEQREGESLAQARDVAGRRHGEVAEDQRERNGRNQPTQSPPLGGRTDDLTGLRAATLPSPTRKTALEMKKEAENPIYEL
jgi:hypothetical protein